MLVSVGCAKGGPVDGVYSVTGAACNGSSNLSSLVPDGATMVVTINKSSGVWVTTLEDGCVETETDALSYPGPNAMAAVQASLICSSLCTINDGCQALEETGLSTAYSYADSGGALTLTVSGSECASGGTILGTEVVTLIQH